MSNFVRNENYINIVSCTERDRHRDFCIISCSKYISCLNVVKNIEFYKFEFK